LLINSFLGGIYVKAGKKREIRNEKENKMLFIWCAICSFYHSYHLSSWIGATPSFLEYIRFDESMLSNLFS